VGWLTPARGREGLAPAQLAQPRTASPGADTAPSRPQPPGPRCRYWQGRSRPEDGGSRGVAALRTGRDLLAWPPLRASERRTGFAACRIRKQGQAVNPFLREAIVQTRVGGGLCSALAQSQADGERGA